MHWPSLAEREQWGRGHPVVASLLLSVVMMAVFGLIELAQGQLGWWFLPAAAGGAAGGTIVGARALRRNWGERPDAANHPLPTRRRMWVRTSDRALRLLPWLGLLACLSWIVDLAKGSRNPVVAFWIVTSVWLVASTRAERARRRAD